SRPTSPRCSNNLRRQGLNALRQSQRLVLLKAVASGAGGRFPHTHFAFSFPLFPFQCVECRVTTRCHRSVRRSTSSLTTRPNGIHNSTTPSRPRQARPWSSPARAQGKPAL